MQVFFPTFDLSHFSQYAAVCLQGSKQILLCKIGGTTLQAGGYLCDS